MSDDDLRLDDHLIDETFDRWLPGAMFPSELVFLAQSVHASGADLVIECGRQDGVSTWTLASMFAGTHVEIQSIDFDEDPERLAQAKARLIGLNATCVSGDIHVVVPELLDAMGARSGAGRRVAVVQDGPKGWEGLATLLSAAHDEAVVMIAQHNLHRGHRSRRAFEQLSSRPCFLERAAPGDERLARLREREMDAAWTPNRPVDHTSLGVIELDPAGRSYLMRVLPGLRRAMGPWHPDRVLEHWRSGDLDYCSRVRRRSRWTLERFRKR